MQGCTNRWEGLLRETLPYQGCRSTLACCRWLPREEGHGIASAARGDEEEGGDWYGCRSIRCSQRGKLWASVLPHPGVPALSTSFWPKGSQHSTSQRVAHPYPEPGAFAETPQVHAGQKFYLLASHLVFICRDKGVSPQASLAWGPRQSTLWTCRISSSHCWTPFDFLLQHRLQWSGLV